MTQIRKLLDQKGNSVWKIHVSATVYEAAHEMNRHRIGALVVESDDQVVGIFTERDLLRRVVAERRNPEETRVDEVMTVDVVCCSPSTTAEEARTAMRERRIRHLPVADEDGRLVGLISIGDLNAELQASQQHTLFLLHQYIHGQA